MSGEWGVWSLATATKKVAGARRSAACSFAAVENKQLHSGLTPHSKIYASLELCWWQSWMYFVVEIKAVTGCEKHQAALDCGALASSGYKGRYGERPYRASGRRMILHHREAKAIDR